MKFILLFIIGMLALSAQARLSQAGRHYQDSVRNERRIDSMQQSFRIFLSDTLRSDSFFNNNFATYELTKKQLEPGIDGVGAVLFLKPEYRRDWVFYYLVFVMFLLLFIKYNFSKLFRNSLRSFYDRAATAEIINDKYSPRWLFVFFSNLFFVFVLTLWFYRSFITTGIPFMGEKPEVFGLLLLLFTMVYFFKIAFHLLSGFLLKTTEAVIIYILNVSITNMVCGIVMLIVTLFLMYSPWHSVPWLLQFSMGILALFVLLRYLRGLSQTVQFFKYNYLYLILYLCTLEIAPWFLIIKYLNKYL